MSTKELGKNEKTKSTRVADLDMKFEVVVIPRFRRRPRKTVLFKARMAARCRPRRGGQLPPGPVTPPGSSSSIQFGVNLTSAAPGSAQAMLLAVSDIEAARSELIAHGVDAGQVFHCETGTACRFSGIGARVTGPHPERLSYYSFVSFSDPDGNGWLLQEVTKRLAGRVTGNTTYASAHDLAQAMIRAAKAHEQHEKRTVQSDANWPDWYAEYMVREQLGEELPE